MRRRVVAVVAAVAVAAVGGAGAAWTTTAVGTVPAGTELLVGHYRPTDQIALMNLTIADGTYDVRYGAEVQFFAARTDVVLSCGLIDASGRVNYLDDMVYPVAAGGGWTPIGNSMAYDVPAITLGVRCRPSMPGSYGIAFRDVTLTATPIG